MANENPAGAIADRVSAIDADIPRQRSTVDAARVLAVRLGTKAEMAIDTALASGEIAKRTKLALDLAVRRGFKGDDVLPAAVAAMLRQQIRESVGFLTAIAEEADREAMRLEGEARALRRLLADGGLEAVGAAVAPPAPETPADGHVAPTDAGLVEASEG